MPGELSGVGRGQGAESQGADSADAGRAAGRTSATRKLGEIYSEKVLWQCTTCGACENQCPVGIEHVPLIVGARRGLVSNGEAPAYLGGMYNNLERRRNIWGLGYEQRQKFIEAAGLEIFDPARHEWLVWLGCAGAFEADYQKSLRALFDILRARGRDLRRAGEGSLQRRSGEADRERVHVSGAGQPERRGAQGGQREEDPHVVPALPQDARRRLPPLRVRRRGRAFVGPGGLADARRAAGRWVRGSTTAVTFHDPCYLGRYAGHVDEPRELLARFGADIKEPVRNRDNPFCCGAGGGLLFADKEEEPGSRISDVRFKQLQDTGASTVVTACPFCSIMLKGAQASAQADTQFVDLMTFVKDRL